MDHPIFDLLTTKGLKSWEKIVSKLIKETSRQYSSVEDSPTSKITIKQNSLSKFHKKHHYFSYEHPLVGRATSNPEDIKIAQGALLDAFEVFDDPFILEQVTSELLAKVLAYRNLKKGMPLYIPWIVDGKCELLPCTVDHVFDLWKSMKAFGIRPCDHRHASLLLFRGTDLSLLSRSSRISILSNFDPEGPGYGIFRHSRKRLKNWMSSASAKNHKIKTIGYSLGGALASYLLLNEPHFFSESSSSIIFNQPGLREPLLEKFHKAQKAHPFSLRSFISSGDVVSKFGYLYCETLGLSIPKTTPSLFEAHTTLYCALKDININRIDLDKENLCPSREFYSKIHSKTSHLFYKLGIKLFLP
jgi:hypothetical protein